MHISQEAFQALPETDKAELALWQGLFSNPGFALLTQFVTERAGAAKAVLDNADSWDSYQYYRGARDALELVLNLEAVVEYKVTERLEEIASLAEQEATHEDFV